jgi:ubiquitin carboxyl-terminal hydrolase L5
MPTPGATYALEAQTLGYTMNGYADCLAASESSLLPSPPPRSLGLPSSPTISQANDVALKSLKTGASTDSKPSRSPVKGSSNKLIEEHQGDSDTSIASRKRKRSPLSKITQSSTRDKRLCPTSSSPVKFGEDDFNPPYTPLALHEKKDWKGWVEVESEPIYVNTMLRELGVRGVRVEEILDLEHSILSLEPPIYGLIFLFQYQDSDHIAKGNPCPPHVWFANQLPATNACATIALINILLNAKNVELGRPLSYFKEDTMNLTPMERAHCLNEHEFVRSVHNSFASRVDMWLADRIFITKYRNQLKVREKRLRDEQRAAEKAAKQTEAPKQTSLRQKRKTAREAKFEGSDSGEDPSSPEQKYNDESAFHYVVYVPIDGHIWRLDGMSTQPQDLGPYLHENSWLCDAAPHIQARMAEFAQSSGVYFNLMALIKDPASRARESLAENVKALVGIERMLDEMSKDWRSYADEIGDEALRAGDAELQITLEMITTAAETDLTDMSLEKLLQKRLETAKDQQGLKDIIRIQNIMEENEQSKVEKDRLDLNPTIHRILLDLEENEKVHELMDLHRWA